MATSSAWEKKRSSGNDRQRPAERLGIFGGTFDPSQVGHLASARAARGSLQLDLILFVPAARPRLRSEEPAAAAEHRSAMVELAVHGLDWAEVSMVDMDRPGPAYSIDTVADIRRQYGSSAELYLIIGADALKSLSRWKDPEKLIKDVKIVCVGRPGARVLESLPPDHPGRGAIFVEGPMIDVSGTDLRVRLAKGQPVGEELPLAVADYIRKHHLYRRQSDVGRTRRNG
ncbi:MAG: nicotinate (nicotinamide) nucleotide adenylyltransferase [Chloroflexi bacterium]|nr:nicotinate (nicotinamide) nucleotide adenylyltransferase [Chloroflexota bacterium]